jgi:hypothetical protein
MVKQRHTKVNRGVRGADVCAADAEVIKGLSGSIKLCIVVA